MLRTLRYRLRKMRRRPCKGTRAERLYDMADRGEVFDPLSITQFADEVLTIEKENIELEWKLLAADLCIARIEKTLEEDLRLEKRLAERGEG